MNITTIPYFHAPLSAVPPRLLEVEGHPNGSVVKVLPDETSVNLTCASLGGKEAATLTWTRDGQPLERDGDDDGGGGDDDRTATVVYEVVTQPDKLENARSFLTLRPKKTDNGATFTCEAKNEAMRAPMRVVVVLSVMRECTHVTRGQRMIAVSSD